jgi:hypothetical protein
MECPVCYTSKAKSKLVCNHSFCYQCISRWYQEYASHTCPICRTDIQFQSNEDVRELHIQCSVNSRIDDYNTFQDLLEKYRGCSKIKDAEYLRRQHWVEWVIEHRAKNQMYTKYIFYGLQGTQETCYQERHEDQEAGVFTKAYKD